MIGTSDNLVCVSKSEWKEWWKTHEHVRAIELCRVGDPPFKEFRDPGTGEVVARYVDDWLNGGMKYYVAEEPE